MEAFSGICQNSVRIVAQYSEKSNRLVQAEALVAEAVRTWFRREQIPFAKRIFMNLRISVIMKVLNHYRKRFVGEK